MAAYFNTNVPLIKSILLRAIWENEYDPTDYLIQIIQDILFAPDDVIMEAISVLLALPTPINPDVLKECHTIIKNAKFPSEKKTLFDALSSAIEEKLIRHLNKTKILSPEK